MPFLIFANVIIRIKVWSSMSLSFRDFSLSLGEPEDGRRFNWKSLYIKMLQNYDFFSLLMIPYH